jgi:hypothetical protein
MALSAAHRYGTVCMDFLYRDDRAIIGILLTQAHTSRSWWTNVNATAYMN